MLMKMLEVAAQICAHQRIPESVHCSPLPSPHCLQISMVASIQLIKQSVYAMVMYISVCVHTHTHIHTHTMCES
ncbi:hypothetical protein EON63_13535 [archaeon]|nr:MAG: hypothetical protein EON63_13535 [archaeon]